MAKKVLYNNNYMSLFDDGTIGLSDGVGYVDTIEKEEVDCLYKALVKFNKGKQNEGNKQT